MYLIFTILQVITFKTYHVFKRNANCIPMLCRFHKIFFYRYECIKERCTIIPGTHPSKINKISELHIKVVTVQFFPNLFTLFGY